MKFIKNKDLLMRIAAVLVVLAAGIFVLQKVHTKRIVRPVPKTATAERKPTISVKTRKAPEKPRATKPKIPKDKGALLVKLLDSSGKEARYMIAMFKTIDSKTSLFMDNVFSNRMQMISPGNYNMVVDIKPRVLYKDINIRGGRETVLNLGTLTGSLTVKMLDSKGKEARYPVSIKNQNIPGVSTRTTVNRKEELYPGVYDVEISVNPKQEERGIKISAGKEKIADLGSIMGRVLIKSVGKDGEPVRYAVSIKQADTGKRVAAGSTNSSIELVKGAYDIDILSKPIQVKKGVAVKEGEELVIEVTPQTK